MANNNRQGTENIDFPKWDEENPKASLENAFHWAVKQAEKDVGWYIRKIPWKKRPSQILRLTAIAFSIIGALIPIIGATKPMAGYDISNWGYVFVALAFALVWTDKTFGITSGWIRFINTQMALERAIRHLKIDWTDLLVVGARKEGTEGLNQQRLIEKQMVLLKLFLQKVSDLVQRETEDWAQESFNQILELSEKGQKEPGVLFGKHL